MFVTPHVLAVAMAGSVRLGLLLVLVTGFGFMFVSMAACLVANIAFVRLTKGPLHRRDTLHGRMLQVSRFALYIALVWLALAALILLGV